MTPAFLIAPSAGLRHSGDTGGTRASLTAEQVFHEHAARIYNLARRMLGHDADAEDITQEVLLHVVRKLDSFRHESEVSTWLHRMTVNAVLAYRRKCARRSERQMAKPMEQFLEEDVAVVSLHLPALRPEQHVLDQETHAVMEQALATLPPLSRDVYVLASVEGLSNAEIAALLDLGVPAVKSRLHRARLFLRRRLAPHFENAHAG
jgi:RNA polymerase sigma-70 factor (ECF subfamily)